MGKTSGIIFDKKDRVASSFICEGDVVTGYDAVSYIHGRIRGQSLSADGSQQMAGRRSSYNKGQPARNFYDALIGISKIGIERRDLVSDFLHKLF